MTTSARVEELAAQTTDKLGLLSAHPEEKEQSAEASDAESDSDSEFELGEPITEKPANCISVDPSEAQRSNIQATEAASQIPAEAQCDGESVPRLTLLDGPEGSFMKYQCEAKQTKDDFIEMIYLKNINSEDGAETVIACKQFSAEELGANEDAGPDGQLISEAIFEVRESWDQVIPYCYTNNGVIRRGESVDLEDDDGEEEYIDMSLMSAEEVSTYFREKEPEQRDEAANHHFKVAQDGNKISAEVDLPVIQLWIRTEEGQLLGVHQFDVPDLDDEDDEADKPPLKKQKIESGDAKPVKAEEDQEYKLECEIASGVKKVQVFGYGIWDSESDPPVLSTMAVDFVVPSPL